MKNSLSRTANAGKEVDEPEFWRRSCWDASPGKLADSVTDKLGNTTVASEVALDLTLRNPEFSLRLR